MAQPVTVEQAKQLATEILAADSDIARAAMLWARSGEMPDQPVVAARTPKSLAETFYPSQVFTFLMAFREHPERTEQMVKRFHGPRPPASARDRDR